MEQEYETNTAEPIKESLARDIARFFRFTGCSFAVLTVIGAASFALGLVGIVFFDNLFVQAIGAVYAVFGVLFLIKAPEIEKCYHAEFGN